MSRGPHNGGTLVGRYAHYQTTGITMEAKANVFISMESISKGFFEALLNGLWPSEEVLDRAEEERVARLAQAAQSETV